MLQQNVAELVADGKALAVVVLPGVDADELVAQADESREVVRDLGQVDELKSRPACNLFNWYGSLERSLRFLAGFECRAGGGNAERASFLLY